MQRILLALLLLFIAACDQPSQEELEAISTQLDELEEIRVKSRGIGQTVIDNMTLVLEATLKGRDYFLDFDEMELLSKKAAEVCSLTIKEINEKVWHPKMQPLV